VLLACAADLHAQDQDPLFTSMPGRLVSVGTHRLHIYCQGEGSPTVVIDAGLGGFSLEWTQVQAALASQVRVCTYDRAGYGWSEAGTGPRTTRQIAEELYALLVNAGVPEPYVLVGHSFGGYNIRYFASMHPETVAGLVLVDASHPDQLRRLPQPEIKSAPRPGSSWTIQISMPVMPDNYPEQARHEAFVLMSTYKAMQAQREESENFRTSAQQVADFDHLPDVPLLVITRGKRIWPHTDFGDRSELAWAEMQDELCELTRHSNHLIASGSGHLVHLDRPELVLAGILKTVDSANQYEPLRQAELQRRQGYSHKTMLLASDNHFMSGDDRNINPLYGIYNQIAEVTPAGFLLPF
jgi:pimeloyl-ACP methyl ester carboxylesterase